MFFRRKKEPPKEPERRPDPVPAPVLPAAGGPGTPSTAFLTGNDSVDRRNVEILLRAISELSQTRDLEPLLVDIVDLSIEATGAERGLLILADDQRELQVRVARMRGRHPIQGAVRFSTSIVKRVLTDLEPLRAQVTSDSEALELGSSVFDLKLRAVMCLPLVESGGSVGPTQRGVLYVDSKAATREFSQKDLELFAALSQHISMALHNARLNIASVEKARLQESLEIAGQIQRDLMPELPNDVRGYEVKGWYRSAEGTTGDFYDFVPMRKGRSGVFIGDVSGHGIGPALIMAAAKSALRQGLKLLDDPAAIVRSVNEDLGPRMDDGRFLTLFMAIFSPDGAVQTLNAGHTPPLLWRAKTGTIENIPNHSTPLGVMDDFDYEEGPRYQLEPGDMMLLFTDGLVEARRHDDPNLLFEEDGMRRTLQESADARSSAAATAQAIVRAVEEFAGGKRDDDMTLIVVRRTETG